MHTEEGKVVTSFDSKAQKIKDLQKDFFFPENSYFLCPVISPCVVVLSSNKPSGKEITCDT